MIQLGGSKNNYNFTTALNIDKSLTIKGITADKTELKGTINESNPTATVIYENLKNSATIKGPAITNANVTVSQGSIIFNYTFYAGQTELDYQTALQQYGLDTENSTVRLERREGQTVLCTTGSITLSSIGVRSDGTVNYEQLTDVSSAFSTDFTAWNGVPTHVILNLCGNDWTLEPIVITFTDTDMNAFETLFTGQGDFIPGEGGALPAFTPFTAGENKIGGLYVDYNQRVRDPNFGIHSNIDMSFLPPSYFGATGYTLQYSQDGGSNWENYSDVATTNDSQDNFSLTNISGNYKYRLLVNGGSYAGYTSNIVEANLSNIDSIYSGWYLDESMFISGTIAPFVGRGLEASFSVTKYGDPDVSFTDEYMHYHWFRVNPESYELIPIIGETNLVYITTEADAGYRLLIRAIGDEINVGGYAQVMCNSDTVIQNNAFVSNPSDTGFTLNLYKSVNSLVISDLSLTDKDGASIPITAVTQGANSAIFNISAALDPANGPFYLNNNSDFWRITSSEVQGHMVSEGVKVPYEIN